MIGRNAAFTVFLMRNNDMLELISTLQTCYFCFGNEVDFATFSHVDDALYGVEVPTERATAVN